MTHYFIDDQWNLIEGPLSVGEISKLANEYQDKYFPGQKPTVSIQVTNSPQFHGAGCYEPTAKKIWLANEHLTDACFERIRIWNRDKPCYRPIREERNWRRYCNDR